MDIAFFYLNPSYKNLYDKQIQFLINFLGKRTVEVFYEKEITYRGIRGLRFTTGDNFLNEIGSKYSTQCFCSNTMSKIPKKADGCLLKGALDLSPCHSEYCGSIYNKFSTIRIDSLVFFRGWNHNLRTSSCICFTSTRFMQNNYVFLLSPAVLLNN